MKLLILTQKVDLNDDVLGFMHSWILEFAQVCESVSVICLEKGEVKLPENVRVFSLGREKKFFNSPFLKRIQYLFYFYRYIWSERKNYEAVFVHMNEMYIILGWLLWKTLGKKISLWYAHGSISLSLKVAERLTDVIFTSTKSGFRLASKKLNVIGQGIDVETFKPEAEKNKREDYSVITIGRISPVKDYETLIKAAEILRLENFSLKVNIVGGAGTCDQEKYLQDLKKIVVEKGLGGVISFLGPMPNKNITPHLQAADLFVNMSHTGSLDKAILEAMACGVPVLTCNEALLEVLDQYKETLMYEKGNFKALAEKVKLVASMDAPTKEGVSKGLRSIVANKHSLQKFIKIIVKSLEI